MKWLITVVVAVLAFLIGLFGTYNWMHDNEVKLLQQKDKEYAEKVAAALKQTKWETLEPGLRVLRLWQYGATDWPQFAVLEISTEKYKALNENPTDFLNQHAIFTKPVNKGATCVEMKPVPPKDYAGVWYAIVRHKNPSDANGAIFDAKDVVPPHP